FFCCVLPNPRLLTQLTSDALSKMLYRVAARMQFNRWHFLAGNFERASVPISRHYFYPPLVPDLTIWSDQRHAGHALAGVRYAVRVPGPPMDRQPLIVGGNSYRGFYDIRLVRQV